MIASQVVAAGAESASANDGELALFDTGAAQMAQAAGSPVVDGVPVDDPSVEVSLETPEHGSDGGLDLSASQRLNTVRALNADVQPSPHEPGNGLDPAPDAPARPAKTPEPIEDQINTSLTQTLNALDVRPPISEYDEPASSDDFDDEDDDDDVEEKKGGFFSRFRRS